MTRVFDDFNEGKFSKQHLDMLSSRPANFEIQLMVKIIIMCLSPNVFIKFGVERKFCLVIPFFAATNVNNNCILAMS
jgi:hypothetical protein